MAKSEIKVKGAKKIAKNEVIPFTRQLASMLGAGMTILASIQTLEEQCANPEFKKVLQHLGDVIEGGEPLSAGLTDFPVLFDEMYVNMVIAGEQSGEFAPIMRRLAQIMTSSSRLRKKVKSAICQVSVSWNPSGRTNSRSPTVAAASPKKKMTNPGARISASMRKAPR